MAENDKKIRITGEGKKELEERLEYLKSVRRKEVTEEIITAKGHGDLSENAEYDEARKAQAEMESEIAEIEHTLKYAEVIDVSNINLNQVSVGLSVTLLDIEFDEEVKYHLVGPAEADLTQNKISYDSPIGKGIIGHSKGDIVKITAPGGEFEFKIVDISI